MTRIDSLHHKIREEVRAAVEHVNKNILASKVKMLVTQGLRTFAEQDALYAQGRTKPGKIVTNACGGKSIHNYGFAFDFCLIDGNLIWDTVKDFDKDGKSDWLEVVAYFKSLGYVWGGDFKSIMDKPHFEKTFGHTWQSLLALNSSGKVDKDGYVIIPD